MKIIFSMTKLTLNIITWIVIWMLIGWIHGSKNPLCDFKNSTLRCRTIVCPQKEAFLIINVPWTENPKKWRVLKWMYVKPNNSEFYYSVELKSSNFLQKVLPWNRPYYTLKSVKSMGYFPCVSTIITNSHKHSRKLQNCLLVFALCFIL